MIYLWKVGSVSKRTIIWRPTLPFLLNIYKCNNIFWHSLKFATSAVHHYVYIIYESNLSQKWTNNILIIRPT